MVRVKRAYEPARPGDGYRVLVDRLWPRGARRDRLRLDLWAKEVAPPPELRTWFGHDPARFRPPSAPAGQGGAPGALGAAATP